MKMIDPPGGYQFGFPKALPPDVSDVYVWLVENGYPQAAIDEWRGDMPFRVFEIASSDGSS
jgi:hypothetical protein